MFNGDLQVPVLPVRVHQPLHQQGVDRRLPRSGTPGGDVRDRAHHGRPRRRARHGPDRVAPQELDRARGVPVHDRLRARVRLGQLRGRDGEGARALRVRRAAGRAEAAPRRGGPRPARHRRLHLHRDVRPGAVAGARLARLRRRWLGVRPGPRAPDRQRRGRHRGEPARPGSRDGVEPDRRGPARCRVRERRGPPRRHGDRAEGPRHVRFAVAGGRRHGGGRRGRQGDREG